MNANFRRLLSLPLAAAALVSLVSLGACGGAVDSSLDDDDLDIDEADSALTSPDPAGDEDRQGEDDRDCRDGDRHHHKHHLKHKWKVLDRLDGAHDHAITIASLPPGLPARLLEKLHKLDANGDGVVVKDEVKAALRDLRDRLREKHPGKHDKHDKHPGHGGHDDDQD